MNRMSSGIDLTDLFSNQPRHVVWAAVGYDAESDICGRAARQFRTLLRNIHVNLDNVLQPDPLQGLTPGLSEWLSAYCGQSERKRRHTQLQALGDDWTLLKDRRRGGNPAPECVLLLSARRLLDDPSRAELVAELSEFKHRFATFLIVFLDEHGDLLGPDSSEEQIHQWLESFREVATHSSVRLYLTSTTTEAGQFLSSQELCKAVAMTLAVDLVLPRPDAERLLTVPSLEPEVTLHTLGLRAVEFNPEEVVERFADRCTGELLAKTVLASAHPKPVDGQNLVSRVPHLLGEAFPEQAELGAQLWIEEVGGAGEIPVEIPALTGETARQRFKLSIHIGELAEHVAMERTPRRKWPEQVVEWDCYVHQTRLDRLIQRIHSAVKDISLRESSRIRKQLAKLFVSPNGGRSAVALGQQVRDLVDERYSTFVHQGQAMPLGKSVARLNEALYAIPQLPSLLVRTGLLVILQLYLAALVWMLDPSGIRMPILFAAAAVGTLVSSFIVRVKRESDAVHAKVNALADTARRAQRSFVEAIRNNLDQVRDRRLAQTERDLQLLNGLCDHLRAVRKKSVAVPEAASSVTIRCVPDSGQEEQFYEILAQRELSSSGEGQLLPRFTALLETKTAEMLAGGGDYVSIETDLRAFVKAEVQRFCQRFQLWHFLCQRLNHGELDPELAKRVLQPLGDRFPLAFLQGIVVEDGLLDPYRCAEFCVAPLIVRDYVPHDRLALDSIAPCFAALVARVELGRLPMFSDADQPSYEHIEV